MPDAPLFDENDTRTTAFTPAFVGKRYASEWNQWETEHEKQPETKPIIASALLEEDANKGKSTGLSAGTPTKADNTAPEDDPATQNKEDRDKESKKSRYSFGTLGGRVRASTGMLILLFFVLLVFRGLTLDSAESSDKNSGILAPPRISTPSSVIETPQPQPTPTQAPEPSDQVTPTNTDEATATTAEPTTGQTDAPTDQTSPQQPGQNPTEQGVNESSISEPASEVRNQPS